MKKAMKLGDMKHKKNNGRNYITKNHNSVFVLFVMLCCRRDERYGKESPAPLL